MDTHFKVVINSYHYNREPDMNELPLYKSINTIDFKDERAIVKVKEYKNISITFESKDDNDKLYFELFEEIQLNNDSSTTILEDDSGYYIHPGTVTIVDLKNNDWDTILVPGYYQMTVECGRTLHGVLEIVPKDLTKKEWVLMNSDIEEFLIGLSNTFTKRGNIDTYISNEINYDLVHILSFLENNKSYFKNSLRILRLDPKYKIKKNYKWISKNLAPRVDSKSIKNYVKRPDKKEEFYAPERILEFNIKENRWLKYLLSNIKKYLVIILDDIYMRIDNIDLIDVNFESEKISKEKELERLNIGKNTVNQILNEIISFNYESWFNEVPLEYSSHSQSILSNPNFRLIEKWNAELVKEKMNTIFSEKIRNVWKKTDHLYEIWCYIQIIKIIQSLNFKISSGWVFDGDISKNLEEGTVVIFEKDSIVIKLHYNSLIKKYSNETNETHPLFTNHRKNKPDIRIDFFVNSNYIYSIPIDAKYRKFKSIFNDTEYGNMEQLRAYADSPKSILHLKDANTIRRKHHKVISKVIVLYPFNNDSKNYQIKKKRLIDERIEMIEFSPGNIESDVQLSLESAIKDALELYDDIN